MAKVGSPLELRLEILLVLLSTRSYAFWARGELLIESTPPSAACMMRPYDVQYSAIS